MVLALTVCGVVVALVVLGLFVFGLRRRLIQRSGGTFDCSLRWDVPEKPDTSGKGWSYGVARYNGDRIEWYRVCGLVGGSAHQRRAIRRPPTGCQGARSRPLARRRSPLACPTSHEGPLPAR